MDYEIWISHNFHMLWNIIQSFKNWKAFLAGRLCKNGHQDRLWSQVMACQLLFYRRDSQTGVSTGNWETQVDTHEKCLSQSYRVGCHCTRVAEKAMAPHSSTLTWKIPWMEEPGRMQSMRSLRVGHDWATSLSLFTFMHWRRKWQPAPVFLPGESQGRGSLVGGCLWARTELDMTEAT